jgi:hypothetical protein
LGGLRGNAFEQGLHAPLRAGGGPLPITCCRCGTVSVYVMLTDGTTTLGFVVCPPCGEWIGRAITGQRAEA